MHQQAKAEIEAEHLDGQNDMTKLHLESGWQPIWHPYVVSIEKLK